MPGYLMRCPMCQYATVERAGGPPSVPCPTRHIASGCANLARRRWQSAYEALPAEQQAAWRDRYGPDGLTEPEYVRRGP